MKQGLLSAEGEPHQPFVSMLTEANHNARDLKLARFAASKKGRVEFQSFDVSLKSDDVPLEHL